MRTPGLTIFPSIISWINEAILAVKWFVVSGKRGQVDYRGVTLRRHEDKMKCGFCTSQLVAFDAMRRGVTDVTDVTRYSGLTVTVTDRSQVDPYLTGSVGPRNVIRFTGKLLSFHLSFFQHIYFNARSFKVVSQAHDAEPLEFESARISQKVQNPKVFLPAHLLLDALSSY